MTNKINGIDVSECGVRFNHFEKNICELGNRKLGELHYLCSENPNCYFKQLKRLQEENEELKARLKTLDDEVLTIEITLDEFEKYKKYKQALEEIRKKITPVCADCNNIDGFTTWDDCENVCEKGVIKYLKIIDEALK